MTIDILVPVLARPGNAQPLVDSIRANTKVPHRVVFLVSKGDTDQLAACQKTDSVIVMSKEDGYSPKMNLGASLSKAEYVFLGADDLRFLPGWAEAAISRHQETGCRVVGTNDLANPTVMAGKHATHMLVHRSYMKDGTIDEPGKLVHEGYHHMYVDNEFCETAMARDEWVFAPDSYVQHLHPIFNKDVPMDATYQRALSQKEARADLRLYQTRRRLWSR